MGKSVRKISIKGKKFGGIPTDIEDAIEVIIVGVAYVSRMYYRNDSTPESVSAPTCWSADTELPDIEVPDDQRQSARCLDCVHNIRGSGKGSGRACRFVQRIAVVLEDDLETVYQLQLPPASIFGDAVEGAMPLRAYARYLEARETPFVALVTKIYFDTDSDVPKLFFRPVRPLEEQELETVKNMMDHADTITAVTLSVTPIEDGSVSPFGEVDGFKFND
jgi:hypothetical protein